MSVYLSPSSRTRVPCRLEVKAQTRLQRNQVSSCWRLLSFCACFAEHLLRTSTPPLSRHCPVHPPVLSSTSIRPTSFLQDACTRCSSKCPGQHLQSGLWAPSSATCVRGSAARGAAYAHRSELLPSDGLSSRSDGSKPEKRFKHTLFCCIATSRQAV